MVLLARGSWFLVEENRYALLALALGTGTVKGLLIFERSAKKNIARILVQTDNTCLGAVFSFKAWGVILAMILLGRFLRNYGPAHQIYGFIIAAVGWGLLLASRVVWQAWSRQRA
ncbi:MAG: hypothetical protein HY885_11220 [Deltaproteobacteria bacterium]|nr:hypothetical protein [Deltaproteobacteria bacterium]